MAMKLINLKSSMVAGNSTTSLIASDTVFANYFTLLFTMLMREVSSDVTEQIKSRLYK